MTFECHFTQQALDDLDEIGTYTVKQWSIHQAETYTELLYNTCLTIAKDPFLCGFHPRRIPKGMYGYKVGRHIIFYRIEEVFVRVLIIRIIHEQRCYWKLLKTL